MNIRFYNAKILTLDKEENFEIIQGELWVKGDSIYYIGDGVAPEAEPIAWEREIDVEGNLLMPGFKNAHTHTAMTFLRSFADDLPLQEWLYNRVFPKEGQLTEESIYYLNVLGIM